MAMGAWDARCEELRLHVVDGQGMTQSVIVVLWRAMARRVLHRRSVAVAPTSKPRYPHGKAGALGDALRMTLQKLQEMLVVTTHTIFHLRKISVAVVDLRDMAAE